MIGGLDTFSSYKADALAVPSALLTHDKSGPTTAAVPTGLEDPLSYGGSAILADGTRLPLIQNQSAFRNLGAVPSSPLLIVAAYVLAQDIIRQADTNHNGTLSFREIAAASLGVAQSADQLDSNHDGQVSVCELGMALLRGPSIFSA